MEFVSPKVGLLRQSLAEGSWDSWSRCRGRAGGDVHLFSPAICEQQGFYIPHSARRFLCDWSRDLFLDKYSQ